VYVVIFPYCGVKKDPFSGLSNKQKLFFSVTPLNTTEKVVHSGISCMISYKCGILECHKEGEDYQPIKCFFEQVSFYLVLIDLSCNIFFFTYFPFIISQVGLNQITLGLVNFEPLVISRPT
jgi:hypothetical protein